MTRPPPSNIAYLLPATCGSCGGHLEHVTASLVCGTETSAIARCSECPAEWQLTVHMRRMVRPRSAARRPGRNEGAAV